MTAARPPADFAPSTQQFEATLTNEALPPGTRVGGYQIVSVLGRGGFGIVYLALDSSLQRQVAIKEYMPASIGVRCEDQQVWVRSGSDAAAYSAGMTEFLKEAKLLARFDHPSLTRVHSFWEENRTAYLAMPYYDGPTLAAKLRSMPHPPNEAWLRSLLTPLLDALDTLHSAMCYHRDISPENIILLGHDRPVLLDFGVAQRAFSDKTMPLTELLNPAYAPIEQYSESASLPQGPWTDIYALGGVLHFAITGQAPARATVRAMSDPQRPLAEVVKSMNQQFPALHYSASFLHAIDRALSVKPQDRPRNVQEFQVLLDSAAPPVAAATPAATPASIPVPPPIPDSPPPSEFASSEFSQASSFGGRDEPQFELRRPRDEWSAFDPTARRHGGGGRSGVPLVMGLFVAGAVAVGAWWWTQTMQSPGMSIEVAERANARDSNPPPAAVSPPTQAESPAPALAQGDSPDADSFSSNSQQSASAGNAAQPPTESTAAAEAPAAVTPSAAPPVATTPAKAPVASPPPPPAATTAKPTAAKQAPVPAAPAPTTAPTTAPTARTAPPAPQGGVATVATTAATQTPSPAAEPGNPRAICGSRTNFALFYCMQTQCQRDKFTVHPQCLELKRRGEVD